MVGGPRGTSVVGPRAERQINGDVDRALMPRRSTGPDISILNAEAGLGSIIDTSDLRYGSGCGRGSGPGFRVYGHLQLCSWEGS